MTSSGSAQGCGSRSGNFTHTESSRDESSGGCSSGGSSDPNQRITHKKSPIAHSRWACWSCTLMNPNAAAVCAACGSQKPVETRKPRAVVSSASDSESEASPVVVTKKQAPPQSTCTDSDTEETPGPASDITELGLTAQPVVITSIERGFGDTFDGWQVPVLANSGGSRTILPGIAKNL